MQKMWSLLFGVVLLASLGLFIVAPFVGWWLPRNYASFGSEIDGLFYLILGITGFFFILTEGLLVYNLWVYASENGRKSEYSHGNHKLEMLWTAVPAVILLFIAFAQVGAWERIKYVSRMPEPEQVFEVSARQFEWRMRYPSEERMKDPKLAESFATEVRASKRQADDVHVVNEIHIWKGAKVRIYLKTRDVLHSFFLPNLRIKQDAVPGKTIPVWFDAQESNYKWDEANKTWVEDKVWELACAELCGWGHYKMRGKLFVHENKAEYLRWLSQAAAEENRTTAKE